MLSTCKLSKNYTELTLQTGRNLQKLEEKGTSTINIWVWGHAEIQENDVSDTHAKIAASEASFLHSNQVPISLSDAKAAIKKRTLHMWQNHGLRTTQTITFMIFSHWFEGKLIEACMEGRQNLKSIDST